VHSFRASDRTRFWNSVDFLYGSRFALRFLAICILIKRGSYMCMLIRNLYALLLVLRLWM
jgi:hypothetical protein